MRNRSTKLKMNKKKNYRRSEKKKKTGAAPKPATAETQRGIPRSKEN